VHQMFFPAFELIHGREGDSTIKFRPTSFAFGVALGFVLLHYRARGHLGSAFAVASGFLRALLDVLVLPLLLCAYAAQMLSSRHRPFSFSWM